MESVKLDILVALKLNAPKYNENIYLCFQTNKCFHFLSIVNFKSRLFWNIFHHTTNLSTGPPRPPRPAGRVSWLLLVSGSRERVNTNKRESADVRKSSGSVLLSMAAKLRVVAGRDLC